VKKGALIFIILLVLVFLALVAGKIIKTRMSSGTEVLVEKAQKRDIVESVKAFGRLSPEVEVEISSEIIGKIGEILVEEGDTVEKSDTLIKLDKTRYLAGLSSAQANLRSARSQVEQVKANLKQAEENLNNIETMYSKDLSSKNNLMAMQTEVDVLQSQLSSARDGVERAKAVLEEARDDLRRTTIVAPVSGVVIDLNAEAGENVITGTMNNIGSRIMTIAQLNTMEAVVEVDEADVVSLEKGQFATVEIDAFPDTLLTGEVIKIANTANLQQIGGQETIANFEVKIAISNPLTGIRPGMSCSADIQVSKADSVVSVPIQAVVAARKELKVGNDKKAKKDVWGREMETETPGRDSDLAVFIVDGNTANQRIVKTGISDDRYIEITDGLEVDENIVIGRYQALRDLQDGDEIKIIDSHRSSR